MPFRNAHWYLLGLTAFTVFAFWSRYFEPVGQGTFPGDIRSHLHAISALAWMALLILQSWSVHAKRVPLHIWTGRASRFVFPFVIAGLAAILDMSAENYSIFGPNALSQTLFFQASVPILAYLWFYYRALAYRSNVWIHSANLLAMPFLLIESPLSRVLKNYVPYYHSEGFDIPTIVAAIETGLIVAGVLALIVWAFDRKRRGAIGLVGLLSLFQFVCVEVTKDSELVFAAMGALAQIPMWMFIGTGFAIGVLVSLLGWRAGEKAKPQAKSAAG